jgi:predicted amidohydrolase
MQLAGAALVGAAAAGAQGSAGGERARRIAQPGGAASGDSAAGEPVQLLMLRRRWRAGAGLAGLESVLAESLHGFDGERHRLVLLPQADAPAPTAPARGDTLRAIGELARRQRCWVAGAATLRDAGGEGATTGFLIDDAGVLRLEAAKATPDVADGFIDAPVARGTAWRAAVAETPFGRVGLLPGEDVLVPGLVRATMYAGAELMLAPFSAAPTGTAESVAELPMTIGYENGCAVALASRDGIAGFGDLTLDAVSGAGEAERSPTVAARFDVEVIRRARAKISPDLYDNFPLWVRDELFGRIWQQQAAAAQAAGPSTRDGWRAEAQRRIATRERRRTAAGELLDSYLALIVQPATMASLPAEGRRAALAQNIDTAIAQVGRLAAAPNARIALFPEFCFTGAGYRTVPDLLSASVEATGPEVAKLRQWSRDNSIYAAAEFLEIDPAFPGRAFNTAFLIDDRGEILLRHRKLQCVDVFGALPDTTPGSIFDAYVAREGVEDLYQVADTPLGKIGVTICFEVVFPEVSRALANAGAELILQLTAEGYSSTRPAWHALRRKRAFENQAWFLCSNKAYDPARREAWVSYGESQCIDFRGRERDRLAANGPAVLAVNVDMASLRAARRDLRLNTAIWDEPGTYAGAYLQGLGIANNGWTGDPQVNPYSRVGERVTGLADVQDRFYARGVYVRPSVRR